MKKYLLTFAACSMLVLMGCQQAGDDPNALSGMTTDEGVKAEQFFPQDTPMVVSAGIENEQQRKQLQLIGSYFPQEGWQILMAELARDFHESAGDAGVSFEGDLLPAIGGRPAVMVGFAGSFEPPEEPDTLVVVFVEKPEVFVDWMKIAVEEGRGSEQTYKSYSIYSPPEEESYIALYEDVLLVGSTMQFVKEALDRAEKGGPSLLSNASYQKGLAMFPDHFGFFYIDPAFSADVMKAEEDLPDDAAIIDLLDAIEGEFIVFSAEEEGVRMHVAVYGDEEKWEQLDEEFGFSAKNEPIYMHRMVPGEGILFYTEGANLKGAVDVVDSIYKSMPGLEDVLPMVRRGLASQDIDLEEDVLVFMDKGFAFALYDTGSLFPGIGLFVDASSNRAAAESLMQKLYEKIEEQLKSAPADVAPLVVHEATATKGGEDYVLRLDLSQLTDEQKASVPEEILNTPIELHYGVDVDDMAYIAFYPGFDTGDFTRLDRNSSFMQDLGMISDSPRGVGYLNIESLMLYVDRVVGFAIEMEGGSIDDLGEYQMVRAYLAPLKSMISGNGPYVPGDMKSEIFIRIEDVRE